MLKSSEKDLRKLKKMFLLVLKMISVKFILCKIWTKITNLAMIAMPLKLNRKYNKNSQNSTRDKSSLNMIIQN